MTRAPLYMIDGIGPFFVGHPRGRINWSKIPFAQLEREGRLSPARFREIRVAFGRFVRTAAELGFNAVSVDDLAHLTDHAFYAPSLRRRLQTYRDEFAVLFDLAQESGLAVYVTTDIAFFNTELEAVLERDDVRIAHFLASAVERLFLEFPQVRGLIVRLGESDGVDVRGEFLSRITVRTPAQARGYLEALLAVCERTGRDLVVRTWTLGGHPIGDLMWNPATYQATFGGLRSDHLVISMKYGETDFFRYVPLAPHFIDDREHHKLIEFQARREYEGFGEFPSFIGWEYAAYLRQLKAAEKMAGTWVWCQTGGWSASRRLTFVEDSSLWNEINTDVTLALVRDGVTVRDAIRRMCARRLPGRDPGRVERFLRLSSDVIRELWYVDDLAKRPAYLRRLRLPPQVGIVWDTLLITGAVRRLLRDAVADGQAKIAQGDAALAKILIMMDLARELALPVADIEFMYRTCEILAEARRFHFGDPSAAQSARLDALIQEYRLRYPGRFRIVTGGRMPRWAWPVVRAALRVLVRASRPYRWSDRFVVPRLMPALRLALRCLPKRHLPEIATSQGMPLQHFLR
jgi:hypothetical protein